MSDYPTIEWNSEFKESHEFYSCQEDSGTLAHSSIREALGEFISDHDTDELREKYLENSIVEVYAFNRDMPHRDDCRFLDELLEKIDEERTNPDGDWRENYPNGLLAQLQQAESDLITLLLEGYAPWACRQEAIVDVPFRDWLDTQSKDYREHALEQ